MITSIIEKSIIQRGLVRVVALTLLVAGLTNQRAIPVNAIPAFFWCASDRDG